MSSSVPRIRRRTTKQEDNEVDRVLRYGEGGSKIKMRRAEHVNENDGMD